MSGSAFGGCGRRSDNVPMMRLRYRGPRWGLDGWQVLRRGWWLTPRALDELASVASVRGRESDPAARAPCGFAVVLAPSTVDGTGRPADLGNQAPVGRADDI